MKFYLSDISSGDILAFTKRLALMLRAGISLSEAIDILDKQTGHVSLRKMLRSISRELSNGQPLYEALSRHPHVFDKFYINLVKVGEESGSLENNLDYLAIHLEKRHEFASKIRSALLYPSIVLFVAFVAGIGLSIFVLPKFIDLFDSLNVPLPLTTRVLLAFAEIMRSYGVVIIGGVFVLFVLFRFMIGTSLVKPFWQRFLLSIPFFGVLLQNIQLAFICRNIGTMLTVGLHLSSAMDSQYDSSGNLVYRKNLEVMKNGIANGRTLGEVLDSNEIHYIPLIARRMIGVGEKTGKLDEAFSYLGEYFEKEVDDQSKNISTVIEPIILIIVGIVVAFIALSIITPIYQFTGSISG